MIFPDIEACRALIGQDANLAEIAAHHGVRAHFTDLLTSFAAQATGSSNRVVRALLLSDVASIDSGELTDKGSLNQRAVLKSRAVIVEALYAEPAANTVIDLKQFA